jgi:hypothetical protein
LHYKCVLLLTVSHFAAVYTLRFYHRRKRHPRYHPFQIWDIAKAAITPLTAVVKAGVVKIAAGPVAVPEAVAPAIDCDMDEASIIEINFKIVLLVHLQTPETPFQLILDSYPQTFYQKHLLKLASSFSKTRF